MLNRAAKIGLFVIINLSYLSCKTMLKGSDVGVGVSQAPQVLSGVLLQGKDEQRAIEAILDYGSEGASEDNESKDLGADSAPEFRKISITLKATATVGQVNELLNRIRSRIVWSAKKSPNLEISVPNSGDPNQANVTLKYLKGQADVITFAVIVEE
jgi:hypothetical protein